MEWEEEGMSMGSLMERSNIWDGLFLGPEAMILI